jgi:hypothetical protein
MRNYFSIGCFSESKFRSTKVNPIELELKNPQNDCFDLDSNGIFEAVYGTHDPIS